MTSTASPQLTIALDAIRVEDHFNPRCDVERAELDGLAASIQRHGLLQPLVVTRDDGQGDHRLIDGERRYRACIKAGLEQVPVIVRDGAPETNGLELALVANMARVDLDVVEQAKGFKRLIDGGLTRKGVAAELGVSQKLVRDRLALLDLDEDLHPQLADATIPPGAVKALRQLAAIAPALATTAVAAIAHAPRDDDPWAAEPPTWSELAEDPVGLVCSVACELPAGIYRTHTPYPVGCFTLTERGAAALGEYSEGAGIDADEVVITFAHDDLAAAEALGAAHRGQHGVSALIVGRDVADQLVYDKVAATLEAQRDAIERRARAAAADGGADTEGAAVVDEQAAQEERRRQREAEQEARRAAVAYNDELAAAILDRLGRVKLDERVLKILAAVDLGDELDKLALRGARYGFPGFQSEQQLKSGRTKRTYLDAGDTGARARAWLSNANGPGALAGRAVSLVAMARYADERAVAQSSRAFWSLDGGRALPWSDQLLDLVDELCEQRLPAHLLEPGREQREAERAQREQLRENEAWLASQHERLPGLTRDERAQLFAEARERSQPYSSDLWRLEEAIRRLDAAEEQAAAGPRDSGAEES